MSNPNIGLQASKGGKARWKGVSKKERIEWGRKIGLRSAAVNKEYRRRVDALDKLAKPA